MKFPSRKVRAEDCQLNWEALSRPAISASGTGGTTASTTFVVGPSVAVPIRGSYRVDFGGSIQIQTAALEQGNLFVHLAGVPVGIAARFVGRDAFDCASVAASFDLSIPANSVLDLRYVTVNGTSVTFSNLWLRATPLFT